MKLDIAGLSFLVTLTLCPSVTAQISSDGTLSTTVSTDDAVNFLIEGGERSLDNLFHSFSEFSIPNLGSAYFDNATDITNIFSRVTGGNISEIQGVIRANGTANLFLINPAGIVFGENASLDVGGSFFASTAESVVFGDGVEFSAIEPQEAPLLTVNITPGLQMGANSGDIIVQGSGHQLTGGLFNPGIRSNTQSNLQVNSGKLIALVGHGVTLSGGVLTAENGRIELGAVKVGTVNLEETSSNFQLDYANVASFGNIQLTEQSLVDASGLTSNGIQLQGHNITLQDGSVALIQTIGNQEQPRGIKVHAAGLLDLSGDVRIAPDQGIVTGVISTRLMTETLGKGRGANIDVFAANLRLNDGGIFMARTYGATPGGNINVNVVANLEINRSSPLNPNLPSGVATTNFSSGELGNIQISASNLTLTNNGVINATNFGQGDGGNVDVNVLGTIEVKGIDSRIVAPSSLGSTVFREGNGANLNLSASRLILENGGNVGTVSFNSGDGGTVTINASEFIEVRGTSFDGALASRLSTAAEIRPLAFRQSAGLPDQPSGNSGNIVLNTPSLIITDGGEVTVNNEGLGNSGNLQINTNQIILDTQGSITAFSASGKGGNINLNVQSSLLLRNSSAITAEAIGTLADNQSVDGGNITINSDLVTLLEASQINANAFEGNGGNITITTQGLFVSPNSSITASSQFGLDGTITLNTPDEENKLAIAELPTNLTDASQQIVGNCSWTRDNTFYITGRSGIAKTPQEYIQDYTMWSDIRDFNQSSVISHQSPVKPERIIEANAWIINERGNVELVAIVPANNQNLEQVGQSCSEEVDS